MTVPTATDTALCANCGHRTDEHDRVAARYCEASGGHDKRGCICPGMITKASDAQASTQA
jgi:hypothetical protein